MIVGPILMHYSQHYAYSWHFAFLSTKYNFLSVKQIQHYFYLYSRHSVTSDAIIYSVFPQEWPMFITFFFPRKPNANARSPFSTLDSIGLKRQQFRRRQCNIVILKDKFFLFLLQKPMYFGKVSRRFTAMIYRKIKLDV